VFAAGPLPPSNAAWLMEIGGWIVFGLVAVFLLYRWRKNGRPETAALLFLGCFTMWWQEFYADWGAYLYYNPDLTLLPWGKSPYTTPNKPVYVLAGYGWFYAGGFAAVLTLFQWFRRRYSSVNYIVALVITVFVPFILWNFVTADGVSYVTNWFQYLESIGPTIHTDKGGLQLIYRASRCPSSRSPWSPASIGAMPKGAPGSSGCWACDPSSPPSGNGRTRSLRGSSR
jgi:hypothetical protein